MAKEASLDPPDQDGWEEMTRLGKTMVEDTFQRLAGLREDKVWREMPETVRQKLEAMPLPRQGMGLNELYGEVQEMILPYGTGNLHPRFWGWVMGAGTPGGVLAELLAAGMNANLWGGNQGPVVVENQVVAWAREMMGFPAGASGLITSGCSLANVIGLAAARGRLEDGAVSVDGMRGLQRTPVVYASGEAHNSLEKAVDLLGLGRRQLRRVPVDESRAMNAGRLAAMLERDLADGFTPMAVVATAGTVSTGAIDPLAAISRLCRKHGIWLHVDGAFGALAVLDPETAPKLAGLEAADSLAFDFHKWLSVPYEAACILVRDGADHQRPFASQTAYLNSTGGGPGGSSLTFGDLGPELSRGFRGLKVWMTLREHGIEKFAEVIRGNMAQARHLARLVEEHDNLELLAPVGLNIVCFRYRWPDQPEETLDRLNERLLLAIQNQGVAVPSHTRLNGVFSLRAAFVNQRTRRQDVDYFVERLCAAAATLGF